MNETTSGSRRALLLSAAGAVLGLGLAGYGLFTAKGTQTSAIPAEDVALVNSKPLLVVDFVSQLQSQYNVAPAQATAQQRQKVLDDMIREELFVQRALELDEPGEDPEVRAALANAVDRQVAADVLSTQPSDEQLRTFYDRHRDKFSTEGAVLLRDLVPVDGSTARAAQDFVQALRSGAGLADAQRKFGFGDSGKLQGEEFYFAARIHLGDALFTKAIALKEGEVSDPIPEDGVSHILVMQKNSPPAVLGFEPARSQILSDYQQDATKRIQAGEEDFLRKRARLQIAPDYRP